MQKIEISCPAKTFIIGEYAVLDGGSAIVLNTAPRFACHIRQGSKSKKWNLSENSPAGQWIKKNIQDFQSVELEWINPYKNKGGLGFSSAQFNIVYAYNFILKYGGLEQIKPQDVWRKYKDLKFEGLAPSGADVISQWVGGVGVFEQNPLSMETLTSSFPDLHCFVFSTGEAFETYKYLKDFQLGDVSDLKHISRQGVQAIKQKDEQVFIESINEYRNSLITKNYVSKKTQEILEKLAKIEIIEAYKGCGAMGAETIIVFYKKEHKESVKKELSFLECVADSNQLTYGLTFHKTVKTKESHH